MKSPFEGIYKGTTVLITGDTGFKGSWLAIWLLMLGADVVGFALPPRTDEDNYSLCGLEQRSTHINGDVRNYNALLDVFSEYSPNIVFHLAAQPLVLESYKDPITTFSTNIMGSVNVFEAVKATPSVQAVINVTSDKCYENKEWLYGYRETDPLGGKDPYSASKAAAEIITRSYWHSFFKRDSRAGIASVRAGNVIGGGDWSAHRIIPDCVRALERDEPIIIEHPNAIRPWQHVLEPLSGYLALGAALCTEGAKYAGAWNFGPLTVNTCTVKQLVEELIKQWGSGRYVTPHNVRRDFEAGILRLDISKAVNLLHWYPTLDFAQMVCFTVEEYKTQNMASGSVLNQRVDHIKRYKDIQERVQQSLPRSS